MPFTIVTSCRVKVESTKQNVRQCHLGKSIDASDVLLDYLNCWKLRISFFGAFTSTYMNCQTGKTNLKHRQLALQRVAEYDFVVCLRLIECFFFKFWEPFSCRIYT